LEGEVEDNGEREGRTRVGKREMKGGGRGAEREWRRRGRVTF